MLTGKIAIVTGGSKGIGKAIFTALAEQGANVVIAARTEATLKEAVDEVTKAHGGNHSYFSIDLTDHSNIPSLIDFVDKKHGKIDILVNSAGEFEQNSFLERSAEESKRKWDLDYWAIYAMSRQVSQYMINKGINGTIINLASHAGISRPSTNFPYQTTYRPMKSAAIELSESVQSEFSKEGHNVRVYAMAPGSVNTPGLRKGMEPDREGIEAALKEKGDVATLEEYYKIILQPKDLGDKAVEILTNPEKFKDSMVEIESYTF